ncbi:hypothetical protein EVAR_25903_1 [Eumeta japonica]|uniref:Uncharacterized protein n=1 Tax=Eumeta variegata TaxID=151549 RepID=A0A4C1W1L6_EUMVA|nr:hypothetical protein EVAR_25903_1 [Eumeta japonica]
MSHYSQPRSKVKGARQSSQGKYGGAHGSYQLIFLAKGCTNTGWLYTPVTLIQAGTYTPPDICAPFGVSGLIPFNHCRTDFPSSTMRQTLDFTEVLCSSLLNTCAYCVNKTRATRTPSSDFSAETTKIKSPPIFRVDDFCSVTFNDHRTVPDNTVINESFLLETRRFKLDDASREVRKKAECGQRITSIEQ